MVANIVLLVLVFGAKKQKMNLYLAAVILGGVKAGIYFAVTRNIVLSIMMGCIFAGLASAFAYLLKRLDRKNPKDEPKEVTYGTPGTEKVVFRWEYFPLSAILILLIGGELLISL
jgi:disulfide bond formation protein DsbB